MEKSRADRPKEKHLRRKKFIGEATVQQLLAATSGEKFGLRDRALLGVIYAGALRAGEASRLDVEEVLFEEGGAIIVGKRWRVRFVPVAGVVLGWLQEYLQGRGSGPLFLTAQGRRMSARLIRKVLDKYSSKIDLEKISPHTLRHSCASHMLAHGMYLPELSRFLGHRSLGTTTIYLHEVPREDDLAIQYQAAHPLASAAP